MSLYDARPRSPARGRALRARGRGARRSARSSRAARRSSTCTAAARRASARTSPTTRGAARASRSAGRSLPLAGEWTLDSFSRHLGDADLFRAPRRLSTPTSTTAAGRSRAPRSTSRCARRARRSATRSAASRAGHLRRLAAARRAADAEPVRAGSTPTRGCASSSTPRPTGRRADRRARRDRRGRLDRLQGRLQGHVGRQRHRPGALPARRRGASPTPGSRTRT